MSLLTSQSSEALPAPSPHGLLQSQPGIEEPFPRRAGDDEGKGHGIEIDRAQPALDADFLIEQDGEQQPDRDADQDVENPENGEVAERHVPVGQAPELLVLLQTDPGVVGQHL
jgi:hypothetical protein